MWVARFLKALPAISDDYPKARWLFLTLTVRNCELTELKATIGEMNQAWKRLTLRKQFPLIGFAKALEITKGKDGSAHPHFHILGMVKPSYFQGKYYLSQDDWQQMWREAMRISYDPIIDIREVKPNPKRLGSGIESAIAETFKYTTKPGDLFGSGSEADKTWLVELTSQLHKTRAIALGGVLKKYLSESEPEELLTEEGSDELLEEATRLCFGWREEVSRYVKTFAD
jgi:plasmid rolling circle replication initiator protein Rep